MISHTIEYEQQARLFRLLTHPARLAILDILRHEEACVCHLEAHLGYRQAYISQQLAVLREAGLVQDRRDGWNVFYRVSQPGIYTLLDAAGQLASHKPRPRRRTDVECACPRCRPAES